MLGAVGTAGLVSFVARQQVGIAAYNTSTADCESGIQCPGLDSCEPVSYGAYGCGYRCKTADQVFLCNDSCDGCNPTKILSTAVQSDDTTTADCLEGTQCPGYDSCDPVSYGAYGCGFRCKSADQVFLCSDSCDGCNPTKILSTAVQSDDTTTADCLEGTQCPGYESCDPVSYGAYGCGFRCKSADQVFLCSDSCDGCNPTKILSTAVQSEDITTADCLEGTQCPGYDSCDPVSYGAYGCGFRCKSADQVFLCSDSCDGCNPTKILSTAVQSDDSTTADCLEGTQCPGYDSCDPVSYGAYGCGFRCKSADQVFLCSDSCGGCNPTKILSTPPVQSPETTTADCPANKCDVTSVASGPIHCDPISYGGYGCGYHCLNGNVDFFCNDQCDDCHRSNSLSTAPVQSDDHTTADCQAENLQCPGYDSCEPVSYGAYGCGYRCKSDNQVFLCSDSCGGCNPTTLLSTAPVQSDDYHI